MAKPIKLRDFLRRLAEADPSIQVIKDRGKGSHLMLFKDTAAGKASYPLPTSSGEVAGPYQKAVIQRFGLPDDAFKKN
jgi:hypothetical protein